jgi:hypothetical protein
LGDVLDRLKKAGSKVVELISMVTNVFNILNSIDFIFGVAKGAFSGLTELGKETIGFLTKNIKAFVEGQKWLFRWIKDQSAKAKKALEGAYYFGKALGEGAKDKVLELLRKAKDGASNLLSNLANQVGNLVAKGIDKIRALNVFKKLSD